MPSLIHERELQALGHARVAGVDEAGRGAWAGPVVAAAVILPNSKSAIAKLRRLGVHDSKQLSAMARAACRALIDAHAISCGIGQASCREIDALGIVPATRLAMLRAVAALLPQPTALIIDAVHLSDCPIHQRVFNFADSISLSVAAASIIAKTTRDALMGAMDTTVPGYGFARHKGYGTAVHQNALRSLGASSEHRRTYAPIRMLL